MHCAGNIIYIPDNMLRVVELLVLVALVSAQTAPKSLLERDPCSTWYPLGGNGRLLETLPYTALCSISADGKQLIMQVATTSNTGVLAGIVATPVHANNNGWTDATGSFTTPAAGYSVVTCNDGSASVVKDDFSPATVFSQTWNIPPTALLSDVKCRFMIAESEFVYWNDVILPAVASDGSSSVIGGEKQQAQPESATSGPFPDFFSTSSGNDTNSTEFDFTTSAGVETSTAILVGDGLETTTTETPVLPKVDPKNVGGAPINYWCNAYGSFYAIVPGTKCISYRTGVYDPNAMDLKPIGKFECIGGTKFSTITCSCDWINNFFCPEFM